MLRDMSVKGILFGNGWEVFKGRTGFKVGFKSSIKFWKDRWRGDTP